MNGTNDTTNPLPDGGRRFFPLAAGVWARALLGAGALFLLGVSDDLYSPPQVAAAPFYDSNYPVMTAALLPGFREVQYWIMFGAGGLRPLPLDDAAAGEAAVIPPSLPGATDSGPRRRLDAVVFATGYRNDAAAEIYVVNFDGTGLTRLTRDATPDYYPAFSPDGAKVAFISWRDGDGAVYIINADGSDPRRLSAPRDPDGGYEDMWPRFTPDGGRVVATRTYYPPCHTFFIPAAGGDEEMFCAPNAAGLVGDGGAETGLVFSPDGRDVIFSVPLPAGDFAHELWYARADGSAARPLIKKTAEDYAFSSDGARVVYTLWEENGRQIFVVGADGSGGRRLTGEGDNYDASFSPDGERILYISAAGAPDPASEPGPSRVCVMNADGTGRRALTAAGDVGAPCFAPGGAKVLFLSAPDGGFAVYIMNADGSGQRRLAATDDYDVGPSWANGVLYDTYGHIIRE